MVGLPKLKAKPFRLAFISALGAFVAVNMLLAVFSPLYQPPITSAVLNSDPGLSVHTTTWSWWLARKWLEQKQAPDVVVFGSSQMGSAICSADARHLLQAIDSLVHRRVAIFESDLRANLGRSVSVFNLASPGAMCSDAYMASKALFSKNLQPKVVFFGIGPRDFIDNTMPYPAATEPYKFYSRYVSAGKLTGLAYPDPMSWLQLAIDTMPCHKLGVFLTDVSSQKPSEITSASSTGKSNSSVALNAVLGGAAEPGKWLVPSHIPSSIWVDNTKEYKNRFRNPRMAVYDYEKQFFETFLAEMRMKGITVIVVAMPSLPMNRKLLSDNFWNEFRTGISSSCTIHNAQFLDLSDSPVFVKEDYLDTVHLNATGGIKLFEILAHYAANDPVIAEALQRNQPGSATIQTAASGRAATK